MRKRLDQLLVEKGLSSSRQQAKEAILLGSVYVDGRLITKPSYGVTLDASLEIRGYEFPYASRGGLKLEKALQVFGLNAAGLVAVDVGASTGGFTSCLLQHGVERVYAVDVGVNQLAPELRTDPRVIVMEQTNIRYLQPDQIGESADLAVIDVSFISLTKVFPAVLSLLHSCGQIVALVKPQFEAGRRRVGKGGVVRDPRVHIDVLRTLLRELQVNNVGLLALDFSPITGPAGNIEYLAYFKKGEEKQDVEVLSETVVINAWSYHRPAQKRGVRD